MKKVISILIVTVLFLSSIVTALAVPLNSVQERNDINGFINGITELVQEYDADKEFTVAENDELSQIQDSSAPNADAETNEVRANTFATSAFEETENSDTDTYTLQDFQTARLIVRANGKFDKFGALEDVSGFEDFHILQYESPEAAMSVYGQLQSEKNITEVTPDVVCTYCGYESSPDDPDIISKDEFLNDWSRDRTQSKRLCDYLAKSNIPMEKIIVGVVDTGIDYNHEIFEGRVERTYFNASSSGNANDEMDSETLYHGTTVSSIVINNSPKNVKVHRLHPQVPEQKIQADTIHRLRTPRKTPRRFWLQ